MNEILLNRADKEAAVYWHNNYASLVLTLEDTEERLSKANTLSLERYEVGCELIKEKALLKKEIAELQDWIDESTASNIQAYTDGFRQGYKEGEAKYDSEADSQSYADGYANGRKDGEAICVNRIKAMKYPKTRFE